MAENIINSIPNPLEVVEQLGSEIMNVGDVLYLRMLVAPVGRLVEDGINSFRDPKDKTHYFKDAIDSYYKLRSILIMRLTTLIN